LPHEIFCVYKTMQDRKLFKFCGLLGTQWCSWLRHCATNLKVAGSIPHDVTGIFHRHNPSGRIMALGLTQLLTNEYRNIFWGIKADGA
jgi:hypothetical protein